jgi:CheY-like chemotaxis protein
VREIHSPERLLEQVSFFLHRNFATMPEPHRLALGRLHDADQVLRGKRAVIVDDDMRNIFALTSLLEEHGMVVESHDNGRDAIRYLQEHPDIDVVLMDMMMPEIDGIETIRAIRKIHACRDLPIIAVTAKAMKGDREKCMEAGAWDYLSKPVDTDLMIGVLKAWLGR